MIFALLPVEQQTVVYEWEPATDGGSVPLLLIEGTPDAMELAFPCGAEADSDGQLFVSSRSSDSVPALSVEAADGLVTVEVPRTRDDPDGERVGAAVAAPTGAECQVVVRYDRDAAQLAIEAPGDSLVLAVPDDAFDVTGLHWSADAADVRASVQTTPFSMVRNSSMQKIVLGAVILLALASVLPAVRTRRRWRPPAGWWRLHPSEWSMLAVAVVVALVDLPRADDGRILSRARMLAGFDFNASVSNLFENRIVPQRWLYEWVLGTTVGWSSSVLMIRLLSVIAVVAAWILLRRRVLPALVQGKPTTRVLTAAWAVHATFVVAWSATLRPEPLIILLTVVVLAVLATWPAEPRAWPSGVVVAAVGLAAATHLAGLVVAFAALPAAWRGTADLRRSAVPVVTGVAWGSAFGLLAMFPGVNLSRARASAGGFGAEHSFGALDVLRYLSAIDNSTAPMMLATGLGVAGLVASLAAAVNRLERELPWPATAVVVGAALSPLGLLFTPSKWLWHLAVLAPVAVVGWTLIARRLDRARTPTGTMLALLGGVLGLLVAWAMRPVWNARVLTKWWRETSLREVSAKGWADRLQWLAGEDVRWWLWVLIMCAVVLGSSLVIRRRHSQAGVGGALAVGLLTALATVTVAQLTPPVVDAVRSAPEWTFVRQSVVGLVSKDASCGVPAATPALAAHASRSGQPNFDGHGGGIAGHSGAYFYAPCHESMRQLDGVWQVPALLLGGLTHDQRRAGIEYDVVPIGCNSFPQERSGESLCFSELVSEGEPLKPATITWSTSTP